MTRRRPGAQAWRKSSRSTSSMDCVEVATVGTMVAVRDSKAPDGSVLLLASTEWIALLAEIKASPLGGP